MVRAVRFGGMVRRRYSAPGKVWTSVKVIPISLIAPGRARRSWWWEKNPEDSIGRRSARPRGPPWGVAIEDGGGAVKLAEDRAGEGAGPWWAAIPRVSSAA